MAVLGSSPTGRSASTVIRLDPKNVDALVARASCHHELRDDDKALALIAEAEKSGVDGAEVLRQIEMICRSGPEGGAHAE